MSDTFIWVSLGLLAALVNSGSPLVQERFKGDAFSVAVWIKIGTAVLLLPFVLYFGFPPYPEFYFFCAISAAFWAISDVIYFRSVAVVGAGVVTRLLPSAVLLSFLAWFLFDPSLLHKYLDNPWQGGLIAGIIVAAMVFAMNLKSCAASVQGFRLVWFVILAAALAPLVEKIAMGDTPKAQTPFAFLFIQALTMLGFWGIYAVLTKPVERPVFVLPSSWKTGLFISVFTTTALCLRFTALQYVDHPAYLSILLFTDALWVVVYYKIIGRHDDSKVWAGLGIVACAAALVFAKNL